MVGDQRGAQTPHRRRGVMEDTRVLCERDGATYGPADGADSDMGFCPYCGMQVMSGDHRLDEDLGEVFCEQTTMSTYRFCPGCGVGLEGVE